MNLKIKMQKKTIATKNSHIDNTKDILSYMIRTYLPEKKRIFDEYDLNHAEKFCLFESLSEKYRNETFHSDILFSLLNLNTPEIGMINNEEILKNFISLVDKDNKFTIDSSIKIKKECYNFVFNGMNKKRGYMDLLITNAHNQAIIIENKINNAPDQPNQLVRYLKFVTENICNGNSSDIFIMYLTLVPGKYPEIDSYDKNQYDNYIRKLLDAKEGKDGKILKYCSAINSQDKENSLKFFLEKSMEILDKNVNQNDLANRKKIFFEQYKTLLEHLGGNMVMADKELIKEIFKSKDNLETVRNLNEVYSKDVLINSYITDSLKNSMESKGFKYEYDNTGGGLYYPMHENCKFIFIGGDYRNFQIAFGIRGKELNEAERKPYADILEKYFTTHEAIPWYDKKLLMQWVFLEIEPLGEQNSMDEFLKDCTKNIDGIIKDFNNSINTKRK